MLLGWLGFAWADPLLDTMEEALERAEARFDDEDEPPHYIAIATTDVHRIEIAAQVGTIAQFDDEELRFLDVDLRVGTPALDSTHPLRGFSSLDADTRRENLLPLDTGYATRHRLARELDVRYREAREQLIILRANLAVLVEEEDRAHDFEVRTGEREELDLPLLHLDTDRWGERLRALSTLADASPAVHDHELRLSAVREEKRFVDTEGARLRHGRLHARLAVRLGTTADDGDRIAVYDAIDVHHPHDLPTDGLDRWVRERVAKLEELRRAPRAEPYSGPVLLRGEAAGVFFHEVFGHRVEGHRQKREDEGKTFAEYVGEPILPPWIDVVDDPTIDALAGVDLNGHYRWDDEGVRAQPAVLVEGGIFRGFLMGRSPIPGFEHSNGHGRRSPGRAPVARMGTTIVRAHRTLDEEALRAELLRLVREAGLPYGYVVEEIQGGFALTGRVMPNAFAIQVVSSRRVYADGRPDELVRGIDLVGTPLVAFSNLVAAGDQPAVFNGTCGAESGWVPVSAVSPSLLFRRLEFQLKEKGQDRPPLLPKPSTDGAAEVTR